MQERDRLGRRHCGTDVRAPDHLRYNNPMRENIPDWMITRLHANLKAAEISISDHDLEGMIERGFLQVPLAFEELIPSIDTAIVPDYVSDFLDFSSIHSNAPQMPCRPSSIDETAEKIKRREISVTELTERSLERIKERDPVLNVFQLVSSDYARSKAKEADHEIAAGNYRGILHGIPVAVKDLLAMRGTITTAGSKIFAERTTDYDAAVVERLEAAGAIIVGKTRMSEFAYSPGSNNAHYGPTRNPHHLEHDTGGSSSGSGAAVADNLVFAAIGSDTGGSIRIPASHCGIVGLKPTYGRVSLFGADTLSWSLDHLGPLTRSVRDAAILFSVIAGYDPRDPRTRNLKVPYVDQMRAGEIRIGVLREDGSGKPLAEPEALQAWEAGLKKMEVRGAKLVELNLRDFHSLRILNSSIIAMEAASFHAPMLRMRLADTGEFFRQRVLAAFAFGPTSFVRANQARAILRNRMNQIFQQVDLLSTPTMPAGAPALGIPGSTSLTGPFNLLGWPTISLPVGKTSKGLSLGLQFAGKPWDELTVLSAAYRLENS
ncbi:MAG TPA: amidase [Acidobacteriota bacterium]|nr:amidase [Acidobacteriota bacterium]